MKKLILSIVVVLILLAQPLMAAQVVLTWKDNSQNETGFNVQRKLFTEQDSAYVNLMVTAPANVTTVTDTTVIAGQIYCYRVNAFNASGTSPWSAPACMLATPDGLVIVYTP